MAPVHRVVHELCGHQHRRETTTLGTDVGKSIFTSGPAKAKCPSLRVIGSSVHSAAMKNTNRNETRIANPGLGLLLALVHGTHFGFNISPWHIGKRTQTTRGLLILVARLTAREHNRIFSALPLLCQS